MKHHPNGNLKNIMVFFGLARIQDFPTPLSPMVKRVTKTCNLFCNIAAERVEKPCCAFYRPRIKRVLQQIKLLQVGQSYARVMPYTGVTSLAAKQVCLGAVKRATCTDFVAKSKSTLCFLQQLFATCNNLCCCKTGLNVGGKTRNIVIHVVVEIAAKTRSRQPV